MVLHRMFTLLLTHICYEMLHHSTMDLIQQNLCITTMRDLISVRSWISIPQGYHKLSSTGARLNGGVQICLSIQQLLTVLAAFVFAMYQSIAKHRNYWLVNNYGIWERVGVQSSECLVWIAVVGWERTSFIVTAPVVVWHWFVLYNFKWKRIKKHFKINICLWADQLF